MPHVSKKKIDQELWKELSSQLLSVFSHAKDKRHLNLLFNELFTQTERIMFSKRVAVILMLQNEIPQHHITDLLGMSPTTVAKISLNIEIGKYSSILNLSKKEKIDLERVVWNVMTAGGIMPPRTGGTYWRKYKKSQV